MFPLTQPFQQRCFMVEIPTWRFRLELMITENTSDVGVHLPAIGVGFENQYIRQGRGDKEEDFMKWHLVRFNLWQERIKKTPVKIISDNASSSFDVILEYQLLRRRWILKISLCGQVFPPPQPIPLSAMSKAWVCGPSLAGIAGSNSTYSMGVFFLWALCVVR